MLAYFLSELESPVKKLKTLMVSMPRLAMLGLDCVLVSTAEGGGGVEGVAGRGGVAEVVGAAPAVGQVILGVEAHIWRRDEEAACNGKIVRSVQYYCVHIQILSP